MGHPGLCSRDSVLHANSQLTIGFVDGPYGINPMSLEIMIRALQMRFGILQGMERIFDLRMTSKRRGR